MPIKIPLWLLLVSMKMPLAEAVTPDPTSVVGNGPVLDAEPSMEVEEWFRIS